MRLKHWVKYFAYSIQNLSDYKESRKDCNMRKNMIAILLVVCLFTLICGCSQKNSNSSNNNSSNVASELKSQEETTVDEKEAKNIILDIPSTADFLYNCSTVEELKAHSDLIIKATVKEANAWVDESATIGTEYTLEVDKCYFGDTKDTITVNNLGGIILASKYFEKQDDPKMDEVKKKIEANPDDSYVRFQFDGAWQPEEGKQYIWFLESYEENGVVDYTPINVYEGVYEVDENIVKRYTLENMSGTTTGSSQRSDDRMELSEMESRISK